MLNKTLNKISFAVRYLWWRYSEVFWFFVAVAIISIFIYGTNNGYDGPAF